MMKNGVDLDKLKDEIKRKKSEKGEEFQDSDGGGSNIGPKDKFLHGLNEALKTGRPTQSIQKIKNVDRSADVYKAKQEGKSIPQNNNVSEGSNSQMGLADSVEVASGRAPANRSQNNGGFQERDHLLYEELERKKKELSSGGAMNYTQQTNEGYNQSPPQRSNEGQIISEGKLTEVVNDAITNKFGVIVEQAMKDQIMEVYAKSRMQETIEENRDMIKKIVIEVIRELQKNNKKS